MEYMLVEYKSADGSIHYYKIKHRNQAKMLVEEWQTDPTIYPTYKEGMDAFNKLVNNDKIRRGKEVKETPVAIYPGAPTDGKAGFVQPDKLIPPPYLPADQSISGPRL